MTEQCKRAPRRTSNRPTRELRKQIRWTPQEWQRIEAAARKIGKTVVKWQREKLLKGLSDDVE